MTSANAVWLLDAHVLRRGSLVGRPQRDFASQPRSDPPCGGSWPSGLRQRATPSSTAPSGRREPASPRSARLALIPRHVRQPFAYSLAELERELIACGQTGKFVKGPEGSWRRICPIIKTECRRADLFAMSRLLFLTAEETKWLP